MLYYYLYKFMYGSVCDNVPKQNRIYMVNERTLGLKNKGHRPVELYIIVLSDFLHFFIILS